jgi:hypothetical protein
MLTRREVLLQLKRVGVTEASQMKIYLRDFEKYMAENHGLWVEGKRKDHLEGKSHLPANSPRLQKREKREQEGRKAKT